MQPAAVGPFQIVRELGRGGMGEVYLARDTRLDRQVAVKALPGHLGQDPDRLARFQREAKVLASLSHPGIGAIYGLEEGDGRQYLILEYIEGETLAERLSGGAMAIDEVLPIAKQVAEALEAAHEKGVVHRDLKPSNVMVTTEGVVKVLDFGLARSVEGAASATHGPVNTQSPTLTSPAPVHSPTIPGAIMGTAGYMSPEQARGKPVDKRSDIFSFGCVLYEMLTGSMPFGGETVADAIGATLHKESDLTRLPAETPARVRDLLTICLAKDRKNRLHDIGDARLELERAMREPRGAQSGQDAAGPWWRSPRALTAMSLLAVAAVFVALASAIVVPAALQVWREAPSAGQVVRATLGLPRGMVLRVGDRSVAVSPDGSRVVVIARPADGTSAPSLLMRDLSRLEFVPIAGTADATYPFWSPDGRSIAFFADGKLKRIDLAEGIVRVLCDAPAGRGGTWGSRGTIVFAPSAVGGLSIVGDAGGTPTPITTTKAASEAHRCPHMLPDGRRFVYYTRGGAVSGVYAFDPDSERSKLVVASEAEAMVVEPGLLVYVRDDNLMVQPFDLDRLELTGAARPLAAGVQYNTARNFVNLGIGACGTLVYQPLSRMIKSRLAWMPLDGRVIPIATSPMATDEGIVLPDGRRAVVNTFENRGSPSLAVVDLERGTQSPLDDPKHLRDEPVWSPSTQSILCTSSDGAGWKLESLPLAGGAPPRVLLSEPGFEYRPGSVTPDGKVLLFSRWHNRDKAGELMTLGLGEDQAPAALMTTAESEYLPLISPAGDAVAYMQFSSMTLGQGVLKVMAYPSPSRPVQVSLTLIEGDYGWLSSDEVYWVDVSGQVWSATIRAVGGLVDVGAPTAMLGGTPLDSKTHILSYDPQRERFLIAIREEAQDDPGLIIVSDWRSN